LPDKDSGAARDPVNAAWAHAESPVGEDESPVDDACVEVACVEVDCAEVDGCVDVVATESVAAEVDEGAVVGSAVDRVQVPQV
jgi:hypothetical protein